MGFSTRTGDPSLEEPDPHFGVKYVRGGHNYGVDLVVCDRPIISHEVGAESFGEGWCAVVETTEHGQLRVWADRYLSGVDATDQSGADHCNSNWLGQPHPFIWIHQSAPWDSGRQLLTLIEVKLARS